MDDIDLMGEINENKDGYEIPNYSLEDGQKKTGKKGYNIFDYKDWY